MLQQNDEDLDYELIFVRFVGLTDLRLSASSFVGVFVSPKFVREK